MLLLATLTPTAVIVDNDDDPLYALVLARDSALYRWCTHQQKAPRPIQDPSSKQ